ncbi:MAG: caspase family protein [Mesorhizobium sp.]|nr:caspase family protein [Mesorhizobium sp.]MCO5160083.1 caspase family protein [Mesorhizobium sp.]
MPLAARIARTMLALLCIFWCQFGAGTVLARDFATSRAIVVGIDKYGRGGFPDLSFAVADARRVADFLRGQGYDVRLLLDENASRDQILAELHAAARDLTDRDRLLVFFGGHGSTEKIGDQELGYLVPSGAAGVGGMIGMEELRSISQTMTGVRHQLFVLNACYGGSIGILRGVRAFDTARPDYLEQITARQARQFIAAGGPDQQVLDGGPNGLSWFTHYFLEATETGQADLDGDTTITFPELSAYLLPRASNNVQTPTFGALPGHALGEFVFARSGTGAPPVVAEAEIEASHATTRAAALPEVARDFTPMQQPIHDLFNAWTMLDIDAYLDQWSPDARQYVGKKMRRFREIEAARRKLFKRLDAVEVVRYQLWFRGYEDGVASFDASYSMKFHFRDGRILAEQERETYRVAEENGRWVIVENRDYLR